MSKFGFNKDKNVPEVRTSEKTYRVKLCQADEICRTDAMESDRWQVKADDFIAKKNEQDGS